MRGRPPSGPSLRDVVSLRSAQTHEASHPPSSHCGNFRHKKKPHYCSSSFKMAVREGFEPSIRCRIHTFQACSFSHSDTSPFLISYLGVRSSPLSVQCVCGCVARLACSPLSPALLAWGSHSDTSPFLIPYLRRGISPSDQRASPAWHGRE